MEIIKKNNKPNGQQGQTMIEYILLIAMTFGIFIVASETMRKPLVGFLNTFSQGFQGVVRYGDRRIRAEHSLEDKHPGNPERVYPKHFSL